MDHFEVQKTNRFNNFYCLNRLTQQKVVSNRFFVLCDSFLQVTDSWMMRRFRGDWVRVGSTKQTNDSKEKRKRKRQSH